MSPPKGYLDCDTAHHGTLRSEEPLSNSLLYGCRMGASCYPLEAGVILRACVIDVHYLCADRACSKHLGDAFMCTTLEGLDQLLSPFFSLNPYDILWMGRPIVSEVFDGTRVGSVDKKGYGAPLRWSEEFEEFRLKWLDVLRPPRHVRLLESVE